MTKKTFTLLMFLFFSAIQATPQSKHPFFKKVHLNYPGLSQLEFTDSAQNYASSFFILTQWVSKQTDFAAFLPLLPVELRDLVDELSNCRGSDFSFEPLFIEKNAPPLYRFLAIGTVMTSRYQKNSLSGPWAEKGWLMLLDLIETSARTRPYSYEQAALLKTATCWTFFKDAAKWGRQADKLIRKLHKKGFAPSPLCQAILERFR